MARKNKHAGDGKSVVRLPNNGWNPRHYQEKAWIALEKGCKRLLLVWHRRAGKDDICLHWFAIAMIERPGTYWHMLPLKEQARMAIWDAVNPETGIRRIDEAFPDELFEKFKSTMTIKCRINASNWEIKGSDEIASKRGSPPVGVVFSEYAFSNPSAWSYLQPVLEQNGGWALFISTPFGRNHFQRMYEYARHAPDWYAELLTNDDTGVFSQEQIVKIEREQAAERGTQEAHQIVQQEYFCSWDAAIPGAYYGTILEGMERSDPPRITSVPYDPGFAVETWWDLGIRDDTAIWFTQKVGRETRIIDYYEASGKGIDHYAGILAEKRYTYKHCVLPHDAGYGQISQRGGHSLAAVLEKDYGYKNRVVPQTKSLVYSINQCRSFMPTCVFDATKCADGLSKLRQYRRKWNENLKRYDDNPLHDWTSHAADAFRTGVEGQQVLREDAPMVDYARTTRRAGFAIVEDDPLRRY